jgi:hypothetical protein
LRLVILLCTTSGGWSSPSLLLLISICPMKSTYLVRCPAVLAGVPVQL